MEGKGLVEGVALSLKGFCTEDSWGSSVGGWFFKDVPSLGAVGLKYFLIPEVPLCFFYGLSPFFGDSFEWERIFGGGVFPVVALYHH